MGILLYIKKEDFGMQLNDTTKMALEISKKIQTIFKDKVTSTQIYDVNDDKNWRTFKIKFVAYNYFVVVFNYERDIIGCSIEQGNSSYITLSESKDCYSDNNLDVFFKNIIKDLELRIPDKFLKAHGWL